MKIAVTSQGPDLDALVDQRFGRARWFLIVDTESGEFEALDNVQNVESAHGAGIQAAQHVASYGVEAVVTGHVGPNAFRTLTAGGIKLYVGASGTVREAVERYKSGELKQAFGADVRGHWI